ncbi:LacI family transcriptional regulator [Salinibacillus kushneri]|uniref:LacI family transcriptional regulator n=1 Tax=Salinibacillus kushneri TaxID=237682 RepID=A0A1I0AK04_9BACI|nr:LacI family DNA-binding transcriptional regulator [Salinibacillus kushneri]SES94521.1 LacI family transcriptional regulator [Salinibacillus kushneri]
MTSSKDVASYAGVSQTTVSRVLNSPEKVNQKTLNKVKRAMEELNYRPNSIARSLVNKKTRSIALLSGPLHNPFFVETTTSIVNYAKAKGFNINVHFENFGDNMSIYEDVLNHQVDGIILSSILYEDPVYKELQKLDIPFMMFNRKHREKGNYVEMDNFQAGRLATQHLINLNHKNIVWLGGPLTMSTFKGRYDGFKQVSNEYGMDVNDNHIFITDTSKQDIFEKTSHIMSRKHRPTAIFAGTDSIAIYVIDFLIQKGYRVPEDISVIGVDNVELSRHHSFQLTTVGIIDETNLGQIAIEKLIDLINLREAYNTSEFVQETVKTKLYNRSTTKLI